MRHANLEGTLRGYRMCRLFVMIVKMNMLKKYYRPFKCYLLAAVHRTASCEECLNLCKINEHFVCLQFGFITAW